MITAIVLAVIALLVVAAMLSRQTSKTKKIAIEDLKVDKENVGRFDIFELVESEISALGLLDIQGSHDIPHGVLLKVWSDGDHIVQMCAGREYLRYVVSAGITPADATEDDVTLECTEVTKGQDSDA
jgi:hypothetical protein